MPNGDRVPPTTWEYTGTSRKYVVQSKRSDGNGDESMLQTYHFQAHSEKVVTENSEI